MTATTAIMSIDMQLRKNVLTFLALLKHSYAPNRFSKSMIYGCFEI